MPTHFRLEIPNPGLQNNRGPFELFKSNFPLKKFTDATGNGCIPPPDDLRRLDCTVWGDHVLCDAMPAGVFRDTSFFVSEKLAALLRGFQLGEHVFMEKKLRHRGGEQPYFWLHTRPLPEIEPFVDFEMSGFVKEMYTPSGQFVDSPMTKCADSAEFKSKLGYYASWPHSQLFLTQNAANLDLFWFNLPFWSGMLISEKLKNALDAAGVSGIEIKPADFVHISPVSKSALMAAKPLEEFRIPFESFKSPSPVSEFKADYPMLATDFSLKNIEAAIGSCYEEIGAEPATVSGNSPFLDDFVQKMRRRYLSISPKTEEVILEMPVSANRFFGKPCVPAGSFEWPKTSGGRSLAFICQLNLADLTAFRADLGGLPATGMLLFFVDIYHSPEGWPTETGRSRVCFFEKTEDWSLAEFPEDLPAAADFEPIFMDFELVFGLPDDRWHEIQPEHMEHKQQVKAFLDEYNEIALSGFGKIGGYPRCVQGHVGVDAAVKDRLGNNWEMFEANRTEILEQANAYRLLLEFEAGKVGLGAFLGDPAVYFLATDAELAARNFNSVQLVMQGT